MRAPGFGFEYDTVIAGLPQPNQWMPRWLDSIEKRRALMLTKGLDET